MTDTDHMIARGRVTAELDGGTPVPRASEYLDDGDLDLDALDAGRPMVEPTEAEYLDYLDARRRVLEDPDADET